MSRTLGVAETEIGMRARGGSCLLPLTQGRPLVTGTQGLW